MKILGISAFYHDSAAVIMENGDITAAAQEERFSRKKHDSSFPKNAVQFCLNYAGLNISDLDTIVFYDKPFLKFERLLETYYAFAPRGLKNYLSAIPVWIKEKIFMRDLLKKELEALSDSKVKLPEILFPEHHLSHAASAYYPSPFNDAAVLTVDGVGEWATSTICYGHKKDITILKEMDFPHSWGLLYSAVTYYLGFKVNSGEYKLMGLAPYGNPDAAETKNFERLIRENILDIKKDGSLWLNMAYFKYPYGLQMTDNKKWDKLFGFPERKPEAEIKKYHMNLAYAFQKITEEGMLRLAREARDLTHSRNLVLAGGVALNCVANGKILRSGIFDKIWIQPAAGDAGGALGAAYVAWHIYKKAEKKINSKADSMKGAFLGPEYNDSQIEKMARKYNAPFRKFTEFDQLCSAVAAFINKGFIIGWFQGRMEWGPRALGNRSILGDARNPEMQKKLNLKIKYRESFRPFAPSVLMEDVHKYFQLKDRSPYMLLVADVVDKIKKPLPENYYAMGLKQQLYYRRSSLPAVTHLDYSARIQTVHKDTNPRYWQLINTFKKKTGCSVIVNTSFNVRGEPVVCSPEDAFKCFMRTEMDYLVINNYLFNKKEQKKWKEKEKWRDRYTLD